MKPLRAPFTLRSCLLGPLLGGLLAGCGSTPDLVVPAPPVAAAWPVAAASNDAANSDAAAAAQVHWRVFFSDPRLQTLIATALAHNRDLRIAAARVQEARAQYGITDADRRPTVGLVGSASLAKSPGDLNTSGVPVSERYDLSLAMVSFEADLWGRLAGLSEAGRSQVLASQAAQKTVQIALVADVASAYFTLRQMEELTQLARSTVATREQGWQLAQAGRDAGGVPESEVQQYASQLESARASLEALDYQRVTAANRLQYLVGTDLANLPAGLPLEQQSASVQLPAGLPGDVLLQRPDVIAAEHRLRAAHANVAAARAAFLPRILLTAGAGVASAGLSSLFQAGSWTFQPAISMPLLDGGRTAAGRDLAVARQDIAVAEYEKTLQLAFREVADLLAAGQSTQRQLRAAQLAEQSQAYRLQTATARMQAGLGSQLDVLEAQREWLAARQTTLLLRRAGLEAAAQLYRALGGGAPDGNAQLAQAD